MRAREMGGGAGEIQERRIRHHLAADRTAAHRDRGRDAGFARGQGLFRRRETQQRSGNHRRSAEMNRRLRCCAAGWPKGSDMTRTRSTIQDCGGFRRSRRGGRSQAVRDCAEAEAQRNQPGRRLARTGDAFGDVARRRARGEGAGDDGAASIPIPDVTANRFAAVRTATKLEPNSEVARQGQDAASALFAHFSWVRRATICRRSMRSGCFTSFAN